MDRGAVLFGATLFVILAALSSVATVRFGEPDSNAAVASAIKHHLAEFVGLEAIEGRDASFGPLVLCIGSKEPLDVEVIGRDLAGTAIRPVPVDECTSETIEGDFGMFSAITNHYDPAGEEAAYLEIAGVACSSTSACVVDLDSLGSGGRYMIRRKGPVWSVSERRLRWVV